MMNISLNDGMKFESLFVKNQKVNKSEAQIQVKQSAKKVADAKAEAKIQAEKAPT